MPAPRRKYDITSTEIQEIARSTADLVVDEVRARAEDVLPHQLYELQRISQQLAVAASDLVGRGGSGTSESIEPALVQLRAAIVGDLAEQQRVLAEALDRRLDSLQVSSGVGIGDDDLASRLAHAVVASLPPT